MPMALGDLHICEGTIDAKVQFMQCFMYIIHEYNPKYNHIASNKFNSTICQKTGTLNFPGTHSNDYLWVQGTHDIEKLFTAPKKIIVF